MCSVFEQKDFKLCKVPVPKGYPQSQTHSGIGILNGKFILTTSPYPSVKRNLFVAYWRAIIGKLFNYTKYNKPGEYFENPCIYINDDKGQTIPTSFKLAQERPLEESLEPLFGLPSFNSDPDLFIEGDTIYVLNRSIYRKSKKKLDYYMRLFLFEGRILNDRFLLNKKILLREGAEVVGSQCLTKYNGKYILTDVVSNSYNDGITFKGIRLLSEDSIEDLRTSSHWFFTTIESGEYLPWHMSLFIYQKKVYTIMACVKKGVPQRCWQMLGEFSDNLKELKIYQTPLTDYSSYRGSACVDDKGEFILYNTTVREKVKGSNSVDGRDVIMAHMPFEQLLKIVKMQK